MVDQEQADKYAEAARRLEKTVADIFDKYSRTKGALGAGHDFKIVVEWSENSDKEASYQARVDVSTHRRVMQEDSKNPEIKAGKSLFVYAVSNDLSKEQKDQPLISKKLPSPHEAKMDVCSHILELFAENKLCVVSTKRSQALTGNLPTTNDVWLLGHDDQGSNRTIGYGLDKVAIVVHTPNQLG